jgi:hypothetical protein
MILGWFRVAGRHVRAHALPTTLSCNLGLDLRQSKAFDNYSFHLNYMSSY